MSAKASEWEKEFGKQYSLRTFSAMFFTLIIASSIMFDRINLVAAYGLFGLLPALMLFKSQINEYESSFNLMSTLKSKKVYLMFLVLVIALTPTMTYLIADELLETHNQLIERYLEDPDNIMEYNLYVLSQYQKRDPEYFKSYKSDSLKVQQKGMDLMVLSDTGHTPNVLYFYKLDKLFWKLDGVLEDASLGLDQ
jgi:hypothetical protein